MREYSSRFYGENEIQFHHPPFDVDRALYLSVSVTDGVLRPTIVLEFWFNDDHIWVNSDERCDRILFWFCDKDPRILDIFLERTGRKIAYRVGKTLWTEFEDAVEYTMRNGGDIIDLRSSQPAS